MCNEGRARELIHWPPLVPDFDLVASRAALVVVDMQRFTLDPDFGWGPILGTGFPDLAKYYYARVEQTVIPSVQHLLEVCRRLEVPIVFVRVGAQRTDGGDFLRMRAQASMAKDVSAIPQIGRAEYEFDSRLAPRQNEMQLNKLTRSAFTSTGLDSILRNLEVHTLLVCGVLTNSCVESTARDATERGLQTVILSDGAATYDHDSHLSSLHTFARIFGKALTTLEVINALDE